MGGLIVKEVSIRSPVKEAMTLCEPAVWLPQLPMDAAYNVTGIYARPE